MVSPFVHLLRSSARYRARVIRSTVWSVLNTLCDVAPEILIGVAVDIVVSGTQSSIARFGITDSFQQILALACLTLGIWVAESFTQYRAEIGWRNLAQWVQHDLRLSAYRHVQQLDLSHFEDRNAGSLSAILGDDINQLERFLDKGAYSLVHVLTTAITIGGVFFWLAPSVAIWAITPIPIILVASFWFQKRAEPRYASVRAMAGTIAGRLTANLGGIATIQSQSAEEFEVASVERDSQAYLEANRKAIATSSAFVPLIRMAIMAGFIGTLVLGGRLALHGELAVGSFGVLVFLTQRLLWPFTRLAETVDQYQRARASTARVLSLLDLPVRPLDQGTSLAPKDVRGDIRFENLHFSYAAREPLLNGLSLHIAPGQTVALVGATGSGKSTIAKLFLRFYQPQSGRILLDETPIDSFKVQDLRRVIGFVGQDLFLFDGSVADNIAYGAFDAGRDAVQAAARIAHADEFIRELPEGYDTRVGDRGLKLSGGQRQRLAIARALVRDPRILILDEATSAVDNESERLIQAALRVASQGRTTLIIAHRLSTIRYADQIHVLDHGRIIESGTHETLAAKNGVYAGLWRVQTGAAA